MRTSQLRPLAAHRPLSPPVEIVATLCGVAIALACGLPATAGAATTLDPATAPPVPAPATAPSPAEAAAMLANLPLTIFASAGEAPGEPRFEARASSGRILFGDEEVVVLLGGRRAATVSASTSATDAAVLRIRFPGGDPHAVVGADPRPGRINVLRGDDPARWQRDLPTFGAVEYRQLFPGIDLRWEGAGADVESTYRVAPGADPGRIDWLYDGASGARVEPASGDLLLTVGSAGATLRERAPVAWQEVGGQRASVAVSFRLDSAAPPVRVGFTLGAYDPSLPLVIDPTLVWSSYLGGSLEDRITGVAMDAQGFVYLAGTTLTTGFPVAGGYGGDDTGIQAFVTKLNPFVTPASQLIYSSLIGGSGSGDFAEVKDLAIDSSGRSYVVGYVRTIPTGAFPTPNGYQSCAAVVADFFPFFFQLNAAGDDLLYSTCLRGNANGYAYSVALDSSNRVYIGGVTEATNFPTFSTAGAGPFQEDQPGDDGFVTKIDPALSGNDSLVFSTYLGGAGTDEVHAIAVDPNNRTYVTGVTGSADFPVTAGAFDTTIGGGNDAFVTKVDGVGSSLFYSTFLGGSGLENGFGIVADATGSAYVTGQTDSTNFPLRPAPGFLQADQGGRDGFVAKVSPAGDALLYSTYLGGTGADFGQDIRVAGGKAVVAGTTTSGNLPLRKHVQTCTGSNHDLFVAVLGISGQQIQFWTCLSGTSVDTTNAVALGPLGLVVVGAETTSTNVPTISGFDSSCNSCPDEKDGYAAVIANLPVHDDGFELGSKAEWVSSP